MANTNHTFFALVFLLSGCAAESSGWTPVGWTEGSRVYEMGPGFDAVNPTGSGYYHIGLETTVGNLRYADFPFTVIPGKKIYSIQGTSRWTSGCDAMYLATVEVDGYKIAAINDRHSDGTSTLVISFRFDGIPITSGSGLIHVRALNGDCTGNWELQAVLETR